MQIIKQDLLAIQRGIIAHQCNCKGYMGAGLAKQIRQRYPKVYEQYKQACSQGSDRSVLTLGEIQLIRVSDAPLYVANLAGQDGYGYGGQHTDYKASTECLMKLHI